MMADTRLNPDQIDFNSAIAEMRAEKMTDDEIHKEIANEFGTTIADQHMKRGVFAPKEETGIWPKDWERIPNELPWGLPAAVAGVGLLAASQTDKGQQIISNLKNRFFGQTGQPNMPGTALNQAAVAEGAPPAPSLVPDQQSPEQINIQKQQAAKAAIEGRPVVEGVGPTTQSVIDNFSPETVNQQTASLTREQVPSHIPANGPTISNQESKMLGSSEAATAEKNVAKAPSNKKKQPIPAYKTEADIPKGMVFRSDVGNLDRSLVNILGTEGRLYAKDVLNEGKMFGNYSGKDYNKKVSELVGAYGEKLKEITPSIDLTTREGRVAAGLPHTQNYGPALGKAAKVGGVLGTLMTVAQSANAKEAAQAVGESLLPIGLTPSEVQSGKLTAKQLKAFEESQKLGSPYRSVPPPR
jgi:hypothetical protein